MGQHFLNWDSFLIDSAVLGACLFEKHLICRHADPQGWPQVHGPACHSGRMLMGRLARVTRVCSSCLVVLPPAGAATALHDLAAGLCRFPTAQGCSKVQLFIPTLICPLSAPESPNLALPFVPGKNNGVWGSLLFPFLYQSDWMCPMSVQDTFCSA